MQFYIQKLTPEQESLIAIIRDKWIKIGLDTSPTNKFKAEEAINLLYECAELKPPKQILWFDNPLEAINWMICNNDTLCDRFVDYELDYKLRKTVSATIDTVVNADVKRIVEINITSEIYYSFRHISCIGHILKAVWDAFGEDVETYYGRFQSFLVDHPNGFEVEHCAFYEFFHTIGVDCSKMRGWWETSKYCGYWWSLEELAIVTPKPKKIYLDAEGRLHGEGVPAIIYKGFNVYAYHGVMFPERCVSIVLNSLANGMSQEEAMHEYDLTKEQITAALAYAAKPVASAEVINCN
jgi:Protein of unknown function (DUF433)